MPVSFTRLRITGFKSFAEPVVVEIRPGLTGIVGPNGCGKSNVVEALRWAMGESSARSLRGGEMDDVIFAGTAARPSRNIAEVALVVDEAQGAAPPPFHEAPELEIIRRIERGGGSSFRINGREARARDVQTLFADLASGARASAMVSQGRVGAIVAARPEERRLLLEEAAGITGLHARRHEADLKLKAAEANLGRAEDLRGQLAGQLENLKRQARQAARYRTVAASIRAAEAELLALQRARVQAARDAAATALQTARLAVAAATASVTAATARAMEAAAALPALRNTEAAARTTLERQRLGVEQIAAEADRAAAALAEAQARATQVARDLGHAEQGARDAEAALAGLDAEAVQIAGADAAHPSCLAQAEAEAAAAADAAHAAEAEVNRATEHAAEVTARHRALTDALAQAEQRTRRVEQQAARLLAERQQIAAQSIAPERVAAATAAAAAAEQAAGVARQQAEAAEAGRAAAVAAATVARATAREAAERTRAAARATLAAAREAAITAEAARAKLRAEAQALADVLGVRDGERWPRMLDQVTVPAGLEAALGAALGEEMDSAADTAASRHWRELPPLAAPGLPAGATALAALVRGPAALARALSQIGVIEDEAAGAAAQAALLPGQALASRSGAVWRWDGYTIRAGTPTAAAVRLQQRNRLADLRGRLAAAQRSAEATGAARSAAEAADRATRADTEAAEREACAAADAAEREAGAEDTRARAARRAAEQELDRARTAAAALTAQAASVGSKLAALDEQTRRLEAELAEAGAALQQARTAIAAVPDAAAARAAVERTRASLTAARAHATATTGARDALADAAAGRARRSAALAAERGEWLRRAEAARSRVNDLAARTEAQRAALAALAQAPALTAARRASALDALEAAESAHRRAADSLTTAEATATAADRARRAAEQALAAAREQVLRAENESAQADHAWGVVAERILERLGASPALPDPPAEIGAEAEERARRRLDRLLREREDMGPVNLRADVEAEAVSQQIDTITREREELASAIAKLRGSIGHLNREGRARLASVFAQVDRNFQALFARNFGGGRAHLALVGSDDPLLAGLEIYAQPPGKKLAALSLLSGGEQALTALSLIFAVFLCNPAPVCVLDEVDAPLDDANVERFCALLEDMVRQTGTRFLVVTHHHLTMARMDRLYGVTMQERGVSRLLSVDLHQAGGMVEPESRLAAE